MAVTRRLFVDLVARTAKFERSMKSAAGSLRLLTKGFGALAAVAVTALGIRGIGAAIRSLGGIAKRAAAAQAAQSKFNIVFGQSTKVLNDFNQEFSKISGLDTAQFQDLSAQVGILAQGFGFAGDESARFAAKTVALAGDLASINNLNTADVIQKLNSAYIGLTRPIRKLVGALTKQDIINRALQESGKGLRAELKKTEIATAAFNLIAELAGVSIGDLSRTQNEFDNIVRQVTGHVTELKNELAKLIATNPAVIEFAKSVREVLQAAATIARSGDVSLITSSFVALGKLMGAAFIVGFAESVIAIDKETGGGGIFAKAFGFGRLAQRARESIGPLVVELQKYADAADDIVQANEEAFGRSPAAAMQFLRDEIAARAIEERNLAEEQRTRATEVERQLAAEAEAWREVARQIDLANRTIIELETTRGPGAAFDASGQLIGDIPLEGPDFGGFAGFIKDQQAELATSLGQPIPEDELRAAAVRFGILYKQAFGRELTGIAAALEDSSRDAFQGFGRSLVFAIADGALSVADLLKRTFLNIVGGVIDNLTGGFGGFVTNRIGGSTSLTTGGDPFDFGQGVDFDVVQPMRPVIEVRLPENLFGDPVTEARKPGSQFFFREAELVAREGGAL